MAKFLDFNAANGVAMYEDVYEGRQQYHYRQDVEPVLDLAASERNSGAADRAGKKQEFFLYARIPPVIVLELKYKYGVDILKGRQDHIAKAVKLINEHYPKLKTTEKTHTVKCG